MVWNLLLAHFLGDFVFQTDWMVRNRDKLWVLFLHSSIHFLLLFLLAGQFRPTIWPWLTLIALMHFSQDKIKIYVTNKRPDWTRGAFVADQALHYATIFVAVSWLQRATGRFSVPEKPEWAIVAIGYLFVTYVWFISERVFNHADKDYIQSINDTKFSRMLIRSGLVSLFLLARNWATPAVAVILFKPYPPSRFRRRALFTDVGISLLVMVFLLWMLR